MSYANPSASLSGARSTSLSAWPLAEQEAFADRVFSNFDDHTYTYTSVCIASVIRRQQRERERRLRSLQLWLAYFHHATH